MYDAFSFRSRNTANEAVDPPTTDNYASVEVSAVERGEVSTTMMAPTSGPISLNWKNTGANSIHSRVLGCNQKDMADADCEVVVAEAVIASAASRHITIASAAHLFYRFQHRAAAGGSQGASSIKGVHKRI